MKNKGKTFRSLSDLSGLLGTEHRVSPPGNADQAQDSGLPPGGQELELHFSKKGRAGKVATVISGITGSKEQIKELAKVLKNTLGTGGSVKHGEIIIQGNLRSKIAGILEEMGYRTKAVGG